MANLLSERSHGALPKNIDKNPREEAKNPREKAKAVTLRNGRELEEVEKKKVDKGKKKS